MELLYIVFCVIYAVIGLAFVYNEHKNSIEIFDLFVILLWPIYLGKYIFIGTLTDCKQAYCYITKKFH